MPSKCSCKWREAKTMLFGLLVYLNTDLETKWHFSALLPNNKSEFS
jgi:hypothetical protein